MSETLSQPRDNEGQKRLTREELSEMSDQDIFGIGVDAYFDILDRPNPPTETTNMAKRIQDMTGIPPDAAKLVAMVEPALPEKPNSTI